MKTFNLFSKGIRLFILALSMSMAFLVSCNKEDALSGSAGDLQDSQLKCASIPQGTVHLTGFTRFDVYGIKTHQVIVSPEQMFLICEADLTLGDHQSFVLKTQEFMPGTEPLMLYRELTFQGKITNGGQVKFAWPESWWELGETVYDLIARINLHTGYVISGHGIKSSIAIFKGNYDGKHFNADFRVKVYQEKPGTMTPYQEIVEGPIMFGISMELNKINP